MRPHISYWLAAATTGFASPKMWQRWADNLIEASDVPEYWIVKMSLAKDLEELNEAIQDRLWDEMENAWTRATFNSVLGYQFLRYERGDSDFRTFLVITGEWADSGQPDIECEAIYAVLNEYEARIARGRPTADLIEKAVKMFAPFKEEAQRQWEVLQQGFRVD